MVRRFWKHPAIPDPGSQRGRGGWPRVYTSFQQLYAGKFSPKKAARPREGELGEAVFLKQASLVFDSALLSPAQAVGNKRQHERVERDAFRLGARRKLRMNGFGDAGDKLARGDAATVGFGHRSPPSVNGRISNG